MNKLLLPKYNLEMTLLGGQTFNFDSNHEGYYGFTQDKVIELKRVVETPHGASLLHWQTYPEHDDIDFLKNYLRLDVNYENILKKIQKDSFVKKAVKKYPDLRLLKQDFEQCLLSFIISSNNNIKPIRKIIRSMSKKFGKSIIIKNEKIHLFPETKVLAEAKMEDLLECKLGFRAKFIKGAAQHILETNLSKKIKSMDEDNARIAIKKINGIGDKITDCVLVFALGFDNVTPLDVWGKRVCTEFYKLNSKMKYNEMRNWLQNYFNGYTAWAGQFLFEYIRHL